MLSSLRHAFRTQRVVVIGLAAILALLAAAAGFIIASLPDANAFNDRVSQLFAESEGLVAPAEIRLLEILAQSGTAFSDTLAGYRLLVVVLLVFAAALMVLALVFLVSLMALNRRMGEVERAGIVVRSLIVSREEGSVLLNNTELALSEAAMETLAILCEARMDGDILSGRQLEAIASGRTEDDCDDASGAMRIKRLRDQLGNQLVSEILVRNVARKGYVLGIDAEAIRIL